MTSADDTTRSLRWTIYWLLIVASAAASSGRIFSVTGPGRDPQTPFLSANDRSRWATIAALVDHGTFVIDEVIFDPATGKRISGWYTIDLVKHRGHDGREHFYSSKPVLMPTLMAGVYWLVKHMAGVTLESQPFYAGRLVLWLCNIPPLVLMGWLLARLIDRYGRDDWSRVFTMVAASFGTFLTTYSVTLNNHLHAAVCVTISTFSLLALLEGRRSAWHFALAGLFATLALANELPALSFLAVATFAALWCDWRSTLLYFAPPVILVVAAMLGLNYAAHGSFRPPYTQRHDGPVVADIKTNLEALRAAQAAELIAALNQQLKQPLSDQAVVTQRQPVNQGDDVTNRYMLWDDATQQRFALNLLSGEDSAQVREWGNWYDYEGTYWTADHKQGVDQGEPSKLVYAFHCLLGHHGLFSLTPLWLLALAGMLQVVVRRNDPLRWFSLATLSLSVACLAFYIFLRPLEDRNYGGVCNGLRWMMWLIPLYLVSMLPALQRLSGSRRGRTLAGACLAVSVFSASYMPLNPWRHPWLFEYWSYLGWISY